MVKSVNDCMSTSLECDSAPWGVTDCLDVPYDSQHAGVMPNSEYVVNLMGTEASTYFTNLVIIARHYADTHNNPDTTVGINGGSYTWPVSIGRDINDVVSCWSDGYLKGMNL